MDIQILLWLQGLRESLPGFVETVFVWISAFAISPAIVLLLCLIYWCVDRRRGQTIVLGFALSSLCTMFIKALACVYRPWVRSSAIMPAEGALPEATGYSFPSGHSQTAGSIVGGSAILFRDRKSLAIACWILMALIAFSRCFLGVHTPQDVAVGLALGIGSIFVARRLLDWADRAKGRDVIILVASIAVAVAYIALTLLKDYPAEYVNGALVVDPSEMQADCLKSVGMFCGAILGWFLEGRLCRFDTDVSNKTKGIRMLAGSVIVLALRYLLPLPLKGILSPIWLEFLKNSLTTFGALFLAPLAFRSIERRVAP